MRPILFAIAISGYIYAQIVGGVAIVVNSKPITLYDIKEKMHRDSLSKKDASDALIREALQQQELSKRSIKIDNLELDRQIEKIASSNAMSTQELYGAVYSSEGLTKKQFRQKIEETLLAQKLYRSIAMKTLSEPDDKLIEEYYQLHKAEFSLSKEFGVVLYVAQDENALRAKIANPLLNIPSIEKSEMVLEKEKINPQLFDALNRAKIESFLPIMPNPTGGFLSIYLKSKSMPIAQDFEQIKPQIIERILSDERERSLKEYFERSRLSADIEVLRTP